MSQEMVFLLVDEILSSRILIISHAEKSGLALEKISGISKIYCHKTFL